MKAKVVKTGEIVEVYHEPQHGQTTNIYKECVLVNGRMWPEDELNFHVKANEAPEKLYISPTSFEVGENFYSILTTKSEGDIEYIRKDVFIEKARKWFEEQNEMIDLDGNHQCDMESFEDFKKYMEDKA